MNIAPNNSGRPIRRPRAVVCPICNREYGPASINIHMERCREITHKQQMQLPRNERRPMPKTVPKVTPAKKQTTIQPQPKKQSTRNLKAQTISRRPPPAQYNFDPSAFPEAVPNSQNLVPCRRCGRTFVPDRVAKHERVCQGPPKPKPQPRPQPKKRKPAGMPEWKKQHLDFINNVRYAKRLQQVEERGGDIRAVAPPPQYHDPAAGYIQCRYCGRKYAPQVAERHIPKCKDIINKPAPPPGRREMSQPRRQQAVPRGAVVRRGVSQSRRR